MLTEVFGENYRENISLNHWNCQYSTIFDLQKITVLYDSFQYAWTRIMMVPELNLEEERGNYWMKLCSSARIEPGDKNQWSKQGKCYIKKQKIWLRRDWPERSKETSEEYSRCKDQPLPNPTIQPRKGSFAPVLQVWARNGREVAVTDVSGMQGGVVPREVSHWRDPARKQPDWVLGTAAGCSLLLKAFAEDAFWASGIRCWQSWSHQHCRRWVPWKWCALQQPDTGETVFGPGG